MSHHNMLTVLLSVLQVSANLKLNESMQVKKELVSQNVFIKLQLCAASGRGNLSHERFPWYLIIM